MKIDETTKKELRSKLPDYVSMITKPSKRAGKDMYVCPLCGSGSHGGRKSDGAFHLSADQWYCHACQNGGDIFNLYAELNHLDLKRDFPQIVEELCQKLGVIMNFEDDPYKINWGNLIKNNTEPTEDDLRKEMKEIEQTIRELWQKRTDLNNEQWKDNQEELSQIHEEISKKNQRRQEIMSLLKQFEKPEEKEEEPMNQDRIKQIKDFASKISGSPAETYLKDRGFSDEIIKKYQLGYNQRNNSVVIPYPKTDYFTERLISPANWQSKYINLPGDAPIFVIKNTDKNCYFITEGQLDALSMIQAGASNVIASHYFSKIEDLLDKGFEMDGAVIVADRDDPGEKIAQKLTDLFTEKNIISMTVYPPDGYKDSNDLLKAEPEKLKTLVKQWGYELIEKIESQKPEEPKRSKAINVSDYLTDNFYDQDINYFRQYKDRKIGFGNIDKYMTLYPGLCCLGGASSLGKTTFAVNIVDNLLEKGESVIYFSLEQLPIELITKSLIRRMHYLDPASTLTNIDIKNGASSNVLLRAKQEYTQVARNYTIVEGDFHVTAKKIIDYVESYINVTGVKPVIVIDYLQLIAPPDGFKGTQREIIDENLKALKDLSKRNELFILLISSFNRASYKEPVSMESFKESGMIEYTCDYILGLQLSILEDSSFYTSVGSRGGEKDNNNDKKEKKLHEAINQNPKEVELVALKNRNGKQRFKCFFNYDMKYDTFTPDFNSKYDQDSAEADFGNLIKGFDQVQFKEV